ncbi:hypothetical protein [Mesorhizobium caraganae]|uniref:hypothetical protein n=1 Tax=Mesorhizobium caraganae TaxID=483206 RepID=UPI00177CC95E|nr:hypothetical protein [Mesorhizobium caraganae]
MKRFSWEKRTTLSPGKLRRTKEAGLVKTANRLDLTANETISAPCQKQSEQLQVSIVGALAAEHTGAAFLHPGELLDMALMAVTAGRVGTAGVLGLRGLVSPPPMPMPTPAVTPLPTPTPAPTPTLLPTDAPTPVSTPWPL